MIKNENKLKVNRKKICLFLKYSLAKISKQRCYYYLKKYDYSFRKSSKKICNYCLEIFRLSTAYCDGGNNNVDFKQNNLFST